MKVNIGTPPAECVVTITLSEKEAESLLIICGHVGGSPETSRRGHFDALSQVLRAAGINRPSGNNGYIEDVDSGAVFFKDYSEKAA